MSQIIDMGEGKTLTLEPVSQHDSEAAFVEAEDLVEIASMYLDTSDPGLLLHMFKEFVHWLYAKEGDHKKPSDLLRAIITEKLQDMNASTDAPPGERKTND